MGPFRMERLLNYIEWFRDDSYAKRVFHGWMVFLYLQYVNPVPNYDTAVQSKNSDNNAR